MYWVSRVGRRSLSSIIDISPFELFCSVITFPQAAPKKKKTAPKKVRESCQFDFGIFLWFEYVVKNDFSFIIPPFVLVAQFKYFPFIKIEEGCPQEEEGCSQEEDHHKEGTMH
jgi:hypothetical protein